MNKPKKPIPNAFKAFLKKPGVKKVAVKPSFPNFKPSSPKPMQNPMMADSEMPGETETPQDSMGKGDSLKDYLINRAKKIQKSPVAYNQRK